jgi:prevent-host-death family protein
MKDTVVSIIEGRRGFSRLIQATMDNKEKVIITKRQKPVAVIIPYDEYRQSMRFVGYKKIMDARKVFLKAGVKAGRVYKETKKQLEDRS